MFLCRSTPHQGVKLHCLSLNPAFFTKSPLSPWKLAVLPSPTVLLETQHPQSCPCFGAPWAGSRDALVTGEHWDVWTGAGGEQAGSGKEYWEAGQAHGKGIKQGGAGTRMSRQRCWNRHPRQLPYGCTQDFPPAFLIFQFLGIFFPPTLVGNVTLQSR